MTEIYQHFSGDVEFYLVYIREAHALDSPVPNLQGPLLQDPISFTERSSTATQCTADLHLPMQKRPLLHLPSWADGPVVLDEDPLLVVVLDSVILSLF